jgi:hypothetical protein
MNDPSSDRCFADIGHEFSDDIHVDIGFDHGFFHHGEAFSHVRFGEFAFAPEYLKRGLEAFLE